jgi:hypothetical protein
VPRHARSLNICHQRATSLSDSGASREPAGGLSIGEGSRVACIKAIGDVRQIVPDSTCKWMAEGGFGPALKRAMAAIRQVTDLAPDFGIHPLEESVAATEMSPLLAGR